MSALKFNCPLCNQSLEAPDDMAGEEIECPSCNRRINIPNHPEKSKRNRTKTSSSQSTSQCAVAKNKINAKKNRIDKSNIEFKCPLCAQLLEAEAPEEVPGMEIECPSCKQQITIPNRKRKQNRPPNKVLSSKLAPQPKDHTNLIVFMVVASCLVIFGVVLNWAFKVDEQRISQVTSGSYWAPRGGDPFMRGQGECHLVLDVKGGYVSYLETSTDPDIAEGKRYNFVRNTRSCTLADFLKDNAFIK